MYNRQLFKETFSIITASEGTLAEVMKMTIKRKRGVKALRIVPLAVAFVLLFSITALAAVGFTLYENPMAMLRAFFGENSHPISEGIVEYDKQGKLAVNLPGWERIPLDETLADELIADYVYDETVSVSWGGYKLTVEANVYDPLTESGLLYYTVENNSGIKGYGVEVNGIFGWLNQVGNIKTYTDKAGETYIDEAMSTDTKIYLCDYYINSDISENRTLMNIYLCEQIVDYEPAYAGAGPGVKHEIKKTATIKLDNSRDIPTISLSDGNILISPISICIYEGVLGFDISSCVHKIVLRYTDGSEYTLLDTNAFINNSMYSHGQYGYIDGSSDNMQAEQIAQAIPEPMPTPIPEPTSILEPTPMPIDADTITNYHTIYLFNRIVDIKSLSEIILDDSVFFVTQTSDNNK